MKRPSWVDRASIRYKLFIMLAVPLAALLFYSATLVNEKRTVLHEMDKLQTLSLLAVRVNAFVHETQKERGMSSGYLGSKGEKFGESLEKQKAITDARYAEVQAFLQTLDRDAFDESFSILLEKALTAGRMLGEKRAEIVELNLRIRDAIGYYNDLNANFLEIIGFMYRLSGHSMVTNHYLSYYFLQQEKEKAGIERAVLSGTFAIDRFEPGLYEKFVQLVAEEENARTSFLSLISKEGRQVYFSRMSGPVVEEADRMRQKAFAKADEGGFGVDASHWFDVQTQKINLLNEVVGYVTGEMVQVTTDQHKDAEAVLRRTVAISVVAVLIAVLFAVQLVRATTRRMQAEGRLALFRNLINQSNDATFISDPRVGRLLDVNDKACESLGYTREELLTMQVSQIEKLLPSTDEWESLYHELREKGAVINEGIQIRKSGSTFPVEVNVKYIVEGESEFIVAVARDITERKRNEEEVSRHVKKMEQALFRAEDVLNLLAPAPSVVPYFVSSPAYRRVKTIGGGDTVKWLKFRSRYAALYLHDVSGHDIQEILLNILATAIADDHKTNPEKKATSLPSIFLSSMNKRLRVYCRETPDYLTALYLLMDFERRELRLALAGHPKPWLIRPDGMAEQVGKQGFLMGQFDINQAGKDRYEDTLITLEAGQMLFLYSDGLMEQRNAAGKLFEDVFRASLLRRLAGLPVREAYDLLQTEFEKHLGDAPPEDDVSFIFIGTRPEVEYKSLEFVPGPRLIELTRERKKTVHKAGLPDISDAPPVAPFSGREVLVIDELYEAYGGIIDEISEAGWSQEKMNCVEMALVEAITNAIMHGNLCSDRYSVTVSHILHDDVLEFCVADEGKGFDSATLAQSIDEADLVKESGRGLHILGAYTDRMYFNEEGNKCWALFSRAGMAGCRQ